MPQKILQVTDFHLRSALPGHMSQAQRLTRHLPQLLEALTPRIRAEAPNLVAVTGDLVDAPAALLDGDRSHDLKTLVQQSLADYALVRRWLEGLGRPWMVLPGNHDYGPAFDVAFGTSPEVMRIGTLFVHAFRDWEQAGNQALRIGPSRARFEHLLENATEASRELHLQHYLVRPYVEHGYPLLYGDADDIAARVAAAPGRRLLLSGHWHGGTPLVTLGHAQFAVCPAFCEFPHPYRVFEIAEDGAVAMREEALGRSFAPGRRLVLIDRAGLLSPPGVFSLREDAAALLEGISAGAHLAIVSAWDEPESRTATWRGLQNLLDTFFEGFGAARMQADALCIYLPADGGGGRALPADGLPTETELVGRMAGLFGVTPGEVTFLTANPARRAIAGRAGARCPELTGPQPSSADILAAARS
jgi:predicted MPP superfamily phosphohydrolase